MKLQAGLLAIGIAMSAGAVTAELHRSALSHSAPSLSGAPIAGTQSSLKKPITNGSKISNNTTRPSITGGASSEGEDD
jgi:hypothetical protein